MNEQCRFAGGAIDSCTDFKSDSGCGGEEPFEGGVKRVMFGVPIEDCQSKTVTADL